VILRRSSDFAPAELAQLFTASYEGYFVPFQVDEQAFSFMVDAFDLDLEQSLVAVDGETPIGLANLGRRGDRTWLGGVGVVPARRGHGVGEALCRGLLDRARRVGAREMVLEVIVENVPAIALYEKLGFTHVRELEILSLAAAEGKSAAEEADVEEARRTIARLRDGPEPWQRDDATLDKLPELRALTAGAAAAVYRASDGRVSLLQAAGSDEGLEAILGALRVRGPVSAVNYPAGGAVSEVLRATAADVTLRQLELVVAL
jgi:ribosomal protein S18 acetylase RimI-like enzyme